MGSSKLVEPREGVLRKNACMASDSDICRNRDIGNPHDVVSILFWAGPPGSPVLWEGLVYPPLAASVLLTHCPSPSGFPTRLRGSRQDRGGNRTDTYSAYWLHWPQLNPAGSFYPFLYIKPNSLPQDFICPLLQPLQNSFPDLTSEWSSRNHGWLFF